VSDESAVSAVEPADPPVGARAAGDAVGARAGSPVVIRAAVGESPWRRFRRRFLRERSAVVALAFLGLPGLVALLAPLLAPHDPDAQSLGDRLAGPSWDHLLGTDDLGRDALSRMLYATRVSLLAAVQATAVGAVLGVPIGLIAGYTRGWVDNLVSRIADAIMSIPALLLALAIVAVLEPNLTSAMIAIGIVYAPRLFRVTRAASISVREETFVEAARSVGSGPLRIITGHVLPNVLSPLVVQISLSMGFAILFEASISFLGLGVQPPDASWGSMLGRSTRFFEENPVLVVAPGIAILLTVLSFNVIGDGIRDSLGRELRRVS
jgi:ABC-type dipeptide/oligopeptide/nickel transport system permease subunit